jgi:glucose/arabinose dehydrogenase
LPSKSVPIVCLLAAVLTSAGWPLAAKAQPELLVGRAAFGGVSADKPGLRRLIRPQDLPAPYATRSASNASRVVPRPDGASLSVPPDFEIALFARGLDHPRIIRTAPNGDIFVAESAAGRIRVLRAPDGAANPTQNEIFASGMRQPFGIAFYPAGANPQWVYIANTDSVVRFPYRNGDLKARGAPQVIVPALPTGGHWTRDIAFSPDGRRLFVSVGSQSNDAEGMPPLRDGALDRWRQEQPLGAAWASETRRAAVLVFDPEGGHERLFATGLRNCVGLAVHPATGDLWCSTNERDGLGDDLPPDYVTRVREGAFYGWPWYYIGDHEDPRHRGERPDLAGHVTTPDVLLQAHSASLGMTFYDGRQFPVSWHGDGFAAQHGSWNRARRTGYKIVRIRLKDGVPTGEYEDFVTGFAIDDTQVWGRPVGVTIANDGALLFSEDGNGTIWRVTYTGRR